MGLLEKIAAVPRPETGFRENLLHAYAAVGKEEGYSVSTLSDASSVGSMPAMLILEKGSEKVAIDIQFGNEAEIVATIRKLYDSGASLMILVTSSRIRGIGLDALMKKVKDTYSLIGRKFALIDIENKAVRAVSEEKKPEARQQPQANQQQAQKQNSYSEQHRPGPRRKMIYGKRGQHKEQD